VPLLSLDLFVTFPTDNPGAAVQNHRVVKNVISESRLDQEARAVREELLKRKLARDLNRQKQGDQGKDVLRRLEAKGSKAKH
jgi:hypothetical protein